MKTISSEKAIDLFHDVLVIFAAVYVTIPDTAVCQMWRKIRRHVRPDVMWYGGMLESVSGVTQDIADWRNRVSPLWECLIWVQPLRYEGNLKRFAVRHRFWLETSLAN